MKKLLVTIAMVLLPTAAFANFTIAFENTHDQKLIYFFYWIDHPFKSLKPANLATGELGASERRDLSSKYINGKYFVVWTQDSEPIHKMISNIEDGITQITITPRSWIFKREGISASWGNTVSK